MDAGGAVDGQGLVPPHEGEGLGEAEGPEEVVRVPVGDEDGVHGKAGPGPHHLLLGPLPAVEEEGIGAPPYHDAREVSLGCREGACGAQEVDVEGLAGQTKHLLNTERLFSASSRLLPSTTTMPW
jgi:hypothetical protein